MKASIAFLASAVLASWPSAGSPAAAAEAGGAPVRRIEVDPARAAIRHLGVDTEGGGREARNLLRKEGITLRFLIGGEWRSSADLEAAVEPGRKGRTYLLRPHPEGETVRWSIEDFGPIPLMAFRCSLPGQPRIQAVELRFAFDPTVTPTTVIPAEWKDDGPLVLPAIVNAPDHGPMVLSAERKPPVEGRLEGSRKDKWVDLVLDLGKPSQWGILTVDLAPLRLAPPTAGGSRDAPLAAVDLWAKARRGWLNCLQPTAAWGDRGNPFSAPAGILGNNVISDPASCSLWFYADQALWTPAPAPGISAAALVRRTIDWWLDHRTRPTGEVICYWDYGNFLDANAGPLIAAWDYVEATGDRGWLEKRIGKLEFIAAYLSGRDVDGDGMIEAVQSGDLGTLVQPGRSCAWWDALNCGGKDGYTNAVIYRAFRCLADLERTTGRSGVRWTTLADRLKGAYRRTLFNPPTGWLAWWKGADGALHDYASPTLNGIAIEYGLVEPAEGREILDRLWRKIGEVGFTRLDLGVPPVLRPVLRGDYLKDGLGCPQKDDGTDTFGQYMNGGITAGQVLHFLAAHYVVGVPERADRLLRAMLERQARGEFQNGVTDAGGRGIDWTTWDGKPCGYEGYLADSFRFLQAVLLREPAFRERYYRPLAAK